MFHCSVIKIKTELMVIELLLLTSVISLLITMKIWNRADMFYFLTYISSKSNLLKALKMYQPPSNELRDDVS
jgi:hypothetical protein